MKIARNQSEAKYPALWSGLVGGIRAFDGGSPTMAYAGGMVYRPKGSGLGATYPSPGQEIRGNAISGDANNYFNRYPTTITYPVSFSVWYRQTSGANYGDVLALADAVGNYWIILDVESTSAGQRLDVRTYSGGFAHTTSAGQVSLNLWHHLALTIVSTSSVLAYLDGALVASHSSRIPAASNITTVSVCRFMYGDTASGSANSGTLLGEFLEYNRELSLQEVSALSSGKSPFTRRGMVSSVKAGSASAAKPWLYCRSSCVSRPYLQVA